MFKKLGLAATLLAGLTGLTSPVQAATLKWGAAHDIYSLDPYSYGDSYTLAFLNHVYEGLVRYDANLKIDRTGTGRILGKCFRDGLAFPPSQGRKIPRWRGIHGR